jgi:hypothetical protein
VLAGSIAFFLGTGWEPQRFWGNVLVVSYGLVGFGLGSAVLLALFFVTGARWSTLLRPVAEKLTTLLPAGALGVALVLLAYPALYPWTEGLPGGSIFQRIWLERTFFLLRAVIYLAAWLVLVFLLVRASRQQAPAGRDRTRVRISALFLVVFALTCWLASTDWIMSLDPKWTSTIFGIYHFSGMFLGALAATILLAAWSERHGVFAGRLTESHWRDLGTLLFSFSSFWMYIWFSQYLLIWYVNIPEEADYFAVRQEKQWLPLFIANLVLNWGVPFVALLLRSAKESRWVLVSVSLLVLLGRWLDLYLMVLPSVGGRDTAPVVWDGCLFVSMLALGALLLVRRPLFCPAAAS